MFNVVSKMFMYLGSVGCYMYRNSALVKISMSHKKGGSMPLEMGSEGNGLEIQCKIKTKFVVK